ncbi:hypothetical protein Emin_1060 [Elusimicrobium minutum Pei191]|uniref:L-2-amino-thiazoline-4-carboxylic acid hydrolase n=1 Tax=Elusimicrobium minutum (strain Pei191) TaxID=445932 RepID=B2KDL7_ELUMP|nr:L-2-amino-thiazoline-4-carboxylic acid hydrolase [Elusimicrobium minutum]ACC98613.1 hypothetical protein Emin_1060 [Elusimicrobium minutum Pei191]
MNNFYELNKEKYMAVVAAIEKHIEPYIKEHFSDSETAEIIKTARSDFEALYPGLPFIGEANPLTVNLVGAAYEMGIYSGLEKRGLSLKIISHINQLALKDYSASAMTPQSVEFVRNAALSKETIEAAAAESQKKKYTGDWVSEYLPPEPGSGFDTGVKYTHCGIIDLYRKYGKERYLPYICLNDYPMYGAMGISFKRTKTLAHGADCCDFCFKLKGGKMPSFIEDPEELEEFKNTK